MKRKFICIFTVLLLLLAGASNTFAAETFVDESSLSKAVQAAVAATKKDQKPIYVSVPVLMFHHLSTAENAPLTPDSFRDYMEQLTAAGYTSVFLDDLIAFVDGKGTLPEKPVVITFDDGYESNYEYAYPILKEKNMKGDISIIGATVGLSKMPGTGQPITPHFSWQQASEMQNANVMRIHSHTYQLHQNQWTGEVTRTGVLRNAGEPLEAYKTMFQLDTKRLNQLIADHLRYENKVYTYPYGHNDALTESILSGMGFRVTITIDPGVNVIKAGDCSSLKLLKRISCDKNGLDLISLIEEQKRL